MRIPKGFAEFAALTEEVYAEHPLEALSLANGFTCNLLELLTDKETAMKFCKESSVLVASLVKSYMNRNHEEGKC